SIGIWLARLWKREVGAALLLPGIETPWDTAPIIGISRVLGYRFYRPTPSGWTSYEPVIGERILHRDHDLLILHERDASSLDISSELQSECDGSVEIHSTGQHLDHTCR